MVARAGPARYALAGAFAMGCFPVLPEKPAAGCLFRQQTPVTSMRCLRKVRGGTGEEEDMTEIVTAGILVIGDEILSGRTKDKNIGFIAEYLTNLGIDLKEGPVVADER